MSEMRTTAPLLLYLQSEDSAFLAHRLPMAHAAQAAGYDVHVAAGATAAAGAIEREGFRFHPLPWERGSTHPLQVLRTVAAVRSLYRRLLPDLVHHVGLQAGFIGAVAAQGLAIRQLSLLAGMGYVFTSRAAKARLLRGALSPLLRPLFGGRHSAVLVQNPDDRAAITAFGIDPSRVFLIPGSGVDAAAMTPLPEPPGPVAAAYVGRMLDDKGVRTLIAAHAELQRRGRPVRLLLAGQTDPANPTAIPQSEIDGWARQPDLLVLGQVRDIRDVWAAVHIAVLPSRREGLPKSLLEAAACGRAIVATDVPGCREIARPGVNALLVPPDDAAALADAIDRLAGDPALRARFAAAGRQLVESEFATSRIGPQTVALYDRLLGGPARLRSAAPAG